MNIIDLELIDYTKAYEIQRETVDKREKGIIEDTLILVEHPPVITLGRTSHKENILKPRKDMQVVETDRGGDVTVHCPGQIVGYPIIDLKTRGKDIHKHMRNIEEAIIVFLSKYGVRGSRREGFTGVWVDGCKIASIGVGVKRWITYHGFALNINPDLSYFGAIVPCGIQNVVMTSLERIFNGNILIKEVKLKLAKSFENIFENE